MGLDSDKTSKCFCVIFAVFLPVFFVFLYHMSRTHPSFVKIVHVFDLYTP